MPLTGLYVCARGVDPGAHWDPNELATGHEVQRRAQNRSNFFTSSGFQLRRATALKKHEEFGLVPHLRETPFWNIGDNLLRLAPRSLLVPSRGARNGPPVEDLRSSLSQGLSETAFSRGFSAVPEHSTAPSQREVVG
eukprot:RCo050692